MSEQHHNRTLRIANSLLGGRGYLAAWLTSNHLRPTVPSPKVVTSKNVSSHCQTFPRREVGGGVRLTPVENWASDGIAANASVFGSSPRCLCLYTSSSKLSRYSLDVRCTKDVKIACGVDKPYCPAGTVGHCVVCISLEHTIIEGIEFWEDQRGQENRKHGKRGNRWRGWRGYSGLPGKAWCHFVSPCTWCILVLPCSYFFTFTGARCLTTGSTWHSLPFFLATKPPSAYEQGLNQSAGKGFLGSSPQYMID